VIDNCVKIAGDLVGDSDSDDEDSSQTFELVVSSDDVREEVQLDSQSATRTLAATSANKRLRMTETDGVVFSLSTVPQCSETTGLYNMSLCQFGQTSVPHSALFISCCRMLKS